MKKTTLLKVQSINQKYGYGLEETDVHKVTAELEVKADTLRGEEAWLKAFENSLMGIHQNPLKAEIDKKSKDIQKICAVCGSECKPVTLMGGRPSWYCDAHKVVQPEAVKNSRE